jgi:uncharacterized LabA/DUF88 family protein
VKVAVFMDWQNAYKEARRAFDLQAEPTERGVFSPLALAKILAAGNKRGQGGELVRVEIHRGLPNPNNNPKGHGAADKQRQAWLAEDPLIVVPRLRPLKFNPEKGKDEEKGVDVALACSAVEHVLMGMCEVAIIFSHDSDLLPPVETICRLKGPRYIETASWKSDHFAKRIPPPKQIWGTPYGVVNHTIRVEVFDKIETPINYSKL